MTPEEMIETGKKLLNYLKENKLPIALISILVSGLAVVSVNYFNKKTKEYEKAWRTIGELTTEVDMLEFQGKETNRDETLNSAIEGYKKILEGTSRSEEHTSELQ